MPASVSHETGWRLPLAPTEKAWPLTKPGNIGAAVMLKWQIHSKGSGKARLLWGLFLYIARLRGVFVVSLIGRHCLSVGG